jgi:catechol 2,3-dioxygenase-like lactoylglutathione lyase family enzyme
MLHKARIHTLVCQVADLDAARDWYAACRLGEEVLYNEAERLSLLRLCTGTHIALVECPQDAPGTTPRRPYAVLAVPDAVSVRAELEQRGVSVGPMKQQGRIHTFEFFDPDGNLFEVAEVAA